MTAHTLYAQQAVLGAGDALEIAPALIRTAGSRIVSVARGTRDELERDGQWPSDVDVDLLDERTLLAPAFINAHTHLAMVVFRGLELEAMHGNVVEDLYYRVERNVTAADVEAFARLGAYDCLLGGQAMVFDHYYHGDAVARACRDVGIGAVIAPTLQDSGGPGEALCEQGLRETADIDADSALAERGIVSCLGPHASDTVSDELFARALALADSRSLPLHLHAAQSLEEHQRSHQRHGCSPFARLARLGVMGGADGDATRPGALLVHALYASDADLALVGERDMLGYCPYGQVCFDHPAAVFQWLDLRCRVALGTDCAGANDGMNVQQELRAVAAAFAFGTAHSSAHQAFEQSGEAEAASAVRETRQRWLERGKQHLVPARLLASVWSQPGSLHPRARAGVIEPGALANLTLFDCAHPALWPARDPLRALVWGDAASAVTHVLVAGHWRGERGNFARSLLDSDDYREARAEADRRLTELLDRL
ncbi:MAG: amidohydrolase family protein [Myxococcales bacterium]|nr:amidohydrolase family protein [Myxococcales bacterium]